MMVRLCSIPNLHSVPMGVRLYRKRLEVASVADGKACKSQGFATCVVQEISVGVNLTTEEALIAAPQIGKSMTSQETLDGTRIRSTTSVERFLRTAFLAR